MWSTHSLQSHLQVPNIFQNLLDDFQEKLFTFTRGIIKLGVGEKHVFNQTGNTNETLDSTLWLTIILPKSTSAKKVEITKPGDGKQGIPIMPCIAANGHERFRRIHKLNLKKVYSQTLNEVLKTNTRMNGIFVFILMVVVFPLKTCY